MGTMLRLAALAAMVFAVDRVAAQVATPDPDIRGPARRAAGAAGEAVGAPGVEVRIEDRQERRDLRRADDNLNAAARANARIADADRWRYKYHNNQWWYYTPQNRWMYYRDNNWSDYGVKVYVAPRARYTTGYRGTMDDDGYYVRRGRRSYYYRPRVNIGADIGASVELPPAAPLVPALPAIPVPNP